MSNSSNKDSNKSLNKSTLQIINEGNETVDIKIDGEIGYKSYWWEEEDEKDRVLTAKELKAELKRITEIEATRIRVYINSLGGLVNHALNMFDALAAHSAHVTTVIEGGYTASAATIIFMAGVERKISENALFLIHKSLITPWEWSFNENDLKALIEDVQTTDKRLKAIYEKAGVDTNTIENLMNANNGNGKWIDADSVVDYGFATEAIEAKALLTANYRTRLDKQNLPKAPNIKNHIMAKDKGLFGNLFGNMSESEAEKELTDLKGQFDTLKNENSDFKNQIQTLENDLTTEKDKVKALESEKAALKANLEAAHTKVLGEKDQTITDLETERDDLKNQVTDLQAKIDKASGGKSGENENGNDPEILPKNTTANEEAYENNKGFFGFE